MKDWSDDLVSSEAMHLFFTLNYKRELNLFFFSDISMYHVLGFSDVNVPCSDVTCE